MSFTSILAPSKTIIAAICLVVLLLPATVLKAAEEPYVNSIRGTAVGTGARFDVTDEKFLNIGAWNSIMSAPYSLTPENIVELKLNYDTSMFFYGQPFTATVNVNILCYNNPYDTSQIYTQYNNVNLTIRYDTAAGSPYKGVYFMKFTGAYKFRVIVNNVDCPELGAAMPKVLMIEGRTIIKRKYNFLAGSDVTKFHEQNGQVNLSWVPGNYPGAEQFDLEYTVVDDSSLAANTIRAYIAANTPLPAAFLDGLFRNNASRITTPASNYVFHPLYQAGYLLFRVRGIQFPNEYRTDVSAEEQNLRTAGNWNYTAQKLTQPSYPLNVVQLQWHEPNLNWQYTISFSEQGRRDESSGYFDGLLRNRQNVSLNNTSNNAIVEESFFDALGRVAVNVLPVPANDSTMHYFANFNRNKNGKGYSYKDMVFGANCRISPDSMASTSGASRYYSSYNDVNDHFFKKYIPHAEGYPFSVTEYTPDNTGRIFAEGDVGKEFQPGANHDKKYYYGKPTQEELDRLFGSEAGNASHYLKNMVVDANKQISVSYINSRGKTVATALAGLTPQYVESLASNNGTGTDVVKTLLLPQDFSKDFTSNTLLGTSSFMAPISGSYKFKYKLAPSRLEVLHGPSNEFKICNTCYYDIKIYVRDNCNILDSVKRSISSATLFQLNCNEPVADIIDSFTVAITNIGEYNVSYELQVSEAAWQYYDSVHLAQNTNIRPFNSFFTEKLSQADFKGCFNECKSCYLDLGARADFINNKVKPLFVQADSMVYAPEFDVWANALYDSLYAHCASIQSGCAEDPCEEEKELLLEDVKPGGQYATYDQFYNLTDASINALAHRTEVWFYNEDGSYGQIEHNGNLLYANDPSIPLNVFIENFQDNWAQALLPYHPEYCFYLWCTYNSSSKSFDNLVDGMESDSAATAMGYFGSVNSLLNNDPFFQSGGYGYTYYSEMADSLALFSRTMPGYTGPDLNIMQYINWELYCEESNIAPGSCPTATTCRSPYLEWQLYREYYMNLKALFFEKARMAHPSFADCKNCFIGTDNTELFTCTAPPAIDFTVAIDPTYTGTGKRIIVKYKNGEEAVPHKLKITITYQTSSGVYATTQRTFRRASATEAYVVDSSFANYYLVSVVVCDVAPNGGGGTIAAQGGGEGEAITIARQQAMNIRVVDNLAMAVPNNCPCPTAEMFTVGTTGWQCWDGTDEIVVNYSGPEIPACRTVYVDIYWEDYYSGNYGWTTVMFGQGQYTAYGCIGGGVMQAKTAPSAPDKELAARNMKLAPSASKDKKGRAPIKANSKGLTLKKGQTAAQAREEGAIPCCGGGYRYYYFSVQYVYCYDSECFVCPGSEQPLTSLCKDDPRYQQYKNKVRRYTGYQSPYAVTQDVVNNYGSHQGQAQGDMTDNCQSTCEAQADQWIAALSKCTQNQTVLNNIRTALIDVCKSGCNSDHPYGSSSNPAGTQTFQSVIQQYIPGYVITDSCTADLISDPYPYDKQPQFEGRDVIRLESCINTQLSALRTQYQGSGYPGTFHQWLQKQLKEDYKLSAQQLADLETAFANGCKYLKKPLSLPAALNCSNTPACVNATVVLQTYAAFQLKYPGLNSANPNYETLLTNYFNHALAFNLSFEDYNDYIQRSQGGTTGYDLLCNRAMTSQLIVAADVNGCMADVFNLALAQAVSDHKEYIDSVRQAFRMAYMAKCMNALPGLTLSTKLYEYHYTLYYYDQANNLVKTVPPQGVQLLSDAQVAQVQANRFNTNNYCLSNGPEYAFSSSLLNMARDVSYDNAPSGRYTLEAWIKLNNLSDQGIFSYNAVSSGANEAGYHLAVAGSRLFFAVGATPKLNVQTPILSSFVATGGWFHLAITVDNSSLKPVKMYINGNNVPLTYLNNYSSYFYLPPSATNTLKLGGAFANGSTSYMSGSLKQFRWYHRQLGTAEIVQNAYNNCLQPTSTSGMVCYVPVNEGQGSVAEDKVTYNYGSFVPSNVDLTWMNFTAGIYPNHRMPTNYEYNSFNQLIRQNSPDGGITRFWYDVLGRSVASQTAEQKNPKNLLNPAGGRYSYTKYDSLGRIVETGEKYNGSSLSFYDEGGSYDSKTPAQLATWFTHGNDRQVTYTIYDKPNTALVTNTNITNLQTTNSRKRVVSTVYKEMAINSYYDYATHYVYDANGNVKTLFQELKPLRDVELFVIGGSAMRGIRRFDYEYDLIGGKMNKVYYQRGMGDQFIYKYDYDADNKLIAAYSSRNGLIWQNDARYFYYLHGPLARIELGKYNVQGVDYAYTLQGWLKGINSQALDHAKDMAGDGSSVVSAAYQKFGRDVYGFSLGYYSNDYKAIGNSTAPAFDLAFTPPPPPAGTTGNTGHQLYNGNISYSTVALSKISNGQTTGYSYLYDQLNRLTAMKQHSISGASWSYNSFNLAYSERISYDANGNINTYVRKGADAPGMPLAMDNLKYYYYYTATDNTKKEYDVSLPLPGDVKALTNQLAHVDDTEAQGNYATDIDDHGLANYDYDNSGNLIKNEKDSITSMDWTVYGKVKQITRSNGTVINYSYDASGNKVVKQVMVSGVQQSREFYIRDGQGNIMAVYKDQFDYVDWMEQYLYGSGRLGSWTYGKFNPVAPPSSTYYDSIMVGSYQYELTNHLGNVLSVISDKKSGVTTDNVTVSYYKAEVLVQTDYYPFGMAMPGRQFGLLGRHGFNGKENENEAMGMGAMQDYGMRIYDTRLGRFLSVDPLTEKYPFYTPYQFGSNNPILAVDLDGMESSDDKNPASATSPTGQRVLLPPGATNLEYFDGTEDPASWGWTLKSKKSKAPTREELNTLLPPGTLKSYWVGDKKFSAVVGTTSPGSGDWHFQGFQSGNTLAILPEAPPPPVDEEAGTVGKPGTLESMVPVWGSGREAVYNFQKGNIAAGIGHSLLAISDVFLVKSVFSGIGKAVWKEGLKTGTKKYFGVGMSHNYGASVARWKSMGVNMQGYKHHWLISQKTMAAHPWLKPIGNQTWNLTRFSSQSSHMRWAHFQAFPSRGLGAIPGARLMYPISSTPMWLKLGTSSYGGRAFEATVGFEF